MKKVLQKFLEYVPILFGILFKRSEVKRPQQWCHGCNNIDTERCIRCIAHKSKGGKYCKPSQFVAKKED